MQDASQQGPLVSVVVPVFEPGASFDACIGSLLAQSLPVDQVELILVDDGSRDDTPARLDALAAAHPHIRVRHEPGSGWAGRPRNVGIEMATGRYIQFVDQDDRLGPEALERSAAMADANGTDIVIGKVTSDFRGVPHGLFTRDRERDTVWTAPLIDSLTPHKLFRRSFLMEHGIRFPEGRRRLEDQLFMVRAYFAGATASVLASYPCYFYLQRPDGTNAGSATIDPAGYYGNLREVLDVVIASTEPGPDRDGFLARFLRVELLGRLEGDIVRGDDAYRQALVEEVASTIATYIPDGAIASLAPLARARLALVRARDPDRIRESSERTRALHGQARVTRGRWRAGRFELRIETSIADAAGGALGLHRGPTGRVILDPALTDGALAEPLDVTDAIRRPRLQVYLQSAEDGAVWRTMERGVAVAWEEAPRLTVRARIVIDPASVAAGGPLPPGRWELRARLTVAGLDRWAAIEAPAPLTVLGSVVDGRIDRLADEHGVLTVTTGAGTWSEAARGGRLTRRPSGGRELMAVLDVGARRTDRGRPVTFALRAPASGGPVSGDRARTIGRTGVLEPRGRRWSVRLVVGPLRGRLPAGRWEVEAALDGPDGPPTPLGTIVVGRVWGVRWADSGRVGLLKSLRYRISRSVRRTGRQAIAQYRRVRPRSVNRGRRPAGS